MTDQLKGEQNGGEAPRAPAKARITASLRRVILKKETPEEIGKKTDVEKGKVWKSHVNK
jgi:hypothetical protein